MDKLCSRVRAEDAAALEALVRPVRERASAAARYFLLLHSEPAPRPAERSTSSGSIAEYDDSSEEPASAGQIQLQLPEIPADQSAAESWDNLEEVCLRREEHAVWT